MVVTVADRVIAARAFADRFGTAFILGRFRAFFFTRTEECVQRATAVAWLVRDDFDYDVVADDLYVHFDVGRWGFDVASAEVVANHLSITVDVVFR